MFSMVENLEWNSLEGVNAMNMTEHMNRLLVVSTYTKSVLVLVFIQILITSVIIMLSSLLRMKLQNSGHMIPSIIAGLFVLIAFVVVLLIAVVKKIDENYLLNVALAIVYSVCMATAFRILVTQLDAQIKLADFGISLMLFTFALLIGVAIEIDLVDYLFRILITLLVISIIIVVVAVVLMVSRKHKYAAIGVYIGANISLFIMTIIISYVTVGKSIYLLLYPNYSLAAILLYTMFISTLLVNTNKKMVSIKLKVVYFSSSSEST